MTKSEIIQQLEKQYSAFIRYVKGLDEEAFQYSYQQKWTAGQQIQHLVLSVAPLVRFYGMSASAIDQLFGKTDRANHSYQQLTDTYIEQLAEGGQAPSRFLPEPVAFEQKAELIKKLQDLIDQLKVIVKAAQEKDLETLLIPHPLLGKITLKEMLYNAIYHVQHHHRQTESYLTKKNSNYHLAQINIARIKGVNLEDPIMKEFVDNLDRINLLAEQSEGFVWRLKDEENNATNFNPYNDEQVIVNISVWERLEDLEQYVFKTMHAQFLRRRKEWFHKFESAHTAMWWIEAGTTPTVEEAVAKLAELEQHGASKSVFDFKNKYPSPAS